MRYALQLNMAVLHKELRTRMRGRRAAIVITLYLLLLAGAGALVLEAQRDSMRFAFDPGAAARMGESIFTTLAFLQLALVAFIVPGLTGAAIAGERDRQTLDLLLSTQVSSLGIVLGKLLSSVSYIVLLLVAALPVFSLAFLFGGVSPWQITLVFLVSLATAVTLGSIGVAMSTRFRRGQLATIATYAVTFFLSLGTLAISAFIAERSNASGFFPTSYWEWHHIPMVFNPFLALASGLPNLGVPFSRGGWSGLTMWEANLMVDAVIVALCVWLSVLSLRPSRRRSLRQRFTRQAGMKAET